MQFIIDELSFHKIDTQMLTNAFFLYTNKSFRKSRENVKIIINKEIKKLNKKANKKYAIYIQCKI